MNILIVGDDLMWLARMKAVLWLFFPGAMVFVERRYREAVVIAKVLEFQVIVLGPCFVGKSGILHPGANEELYRALRHAPNTQFLFWSEDSEARRALQELYHYHSRILAFVSDAPLPGCSLPPPRRSG